MLYIQVVFDEYILNNLFCVSGYCLINHNNHPLPFNGILNTFWKNNDFIEYPYKTFQHGYHAIFCNSACK